MDQTPEPSPWTRPGFLAAAVLVAVIAAVGVVLAVTNSGDDTKPPAAAPVQTTPAAATTPPSGAGTDSICGLKGTKTTGRLAKAPDAQWDYQGTTAYPVSKEHGPGRTDPSGYRYCFQHTPEGALFMAANAIAQSTDATSIAAWMNYAVAQGQYRERNLANAGSPSSSEGTRTEIQGFRILAYDGHSARVDLATQFSTGGTIGAISGVYELVWQDGDWKFSSDTAEPLDVATIPNTSGYVSWGQ